jgi:hypothetical protein
VSACFWWAPEDCVETAWEESAGNEAAKFQGPQFPDLADKMIGDLRQHS